MIHRMYRKLQLANIRSEWVMVASGEEASWRERREQSRFVYPSVFVLKLGVAVEDGHWNVPNVDLIGFNNTYVIIIERVS